MTFYNAIAVIRAEGLMSTTISPDVQNIHSENMVLKTCLMGNVKKNGKKNCELVFSLNMNRLFLHNLCRFAK